ncbi:MAG: hypothetical protein ACK5LZ_00760 [Anaerorhabdus sp.]
MKKYGLILLLMVGMMGCSKVEVKERVEYENIEELVDALRNEAWKWQGV